MSWGGVADAFTFGLTDFDNKGSSKGFWDWQFDPIGGGSDKKWGPEPTKGFDFLDAYDAFKGGYSNTMGAMGYGSGGSKFLGDYVASRSQTPTSTSPVSTSSAFTAGGGTHSMPGVVIDKPVDFYAFKDNVQYPTMQQGSSGSSGSSGGGILGKVAQGVGILGGLKSAFPLTFAGLCDIRTKTDISPLETTEVNDDLAQIAFFVKELHECS